MIPLIEISSSYAFVLEVFHSILLCCLAIKHGFMSSFVLVYQSGNSIMIKSIFQAIEALFKATTYLLILTMSLAMAGLGAFIIILLAFRIGEFLWVLIFKEAWL